MKPRTAQTRFNHESATEEVLVSKNPNNVVVTLNRPKALNSLNLNMVRAITPLYRQWDTEANISNIILKGQGSKAFCAGGDIVQIYESGKKGTPLCSEFFREEYILNHIIGTLKTPHIAILNGITMGGGVGLSVHGRFRIATENTLFAMPETGIGFFPDVGGSYFLPRLRGSLGMFLGLTGYRLKGKHVAAAGVATHFVPQGSLDDLEAKLGQLRTKDLSEIESLLKNFTQPASWDGSEVGQNLDMISEVFSMDSVEAIMKHLAGEKTEFSEKIFQTLLKMSPTSLKVTHRQIQKGKNMSFEEGLEMEYAMSQHFMKGNDFYEGVGELLVTKTNNPQWFPRTLEEVKEHDVEKHFQELPEYSLKFAKTRDAKL